MHENLTHSSQQRRVSDQFTHQQEHRPAFDRDGAAMQSQLPAPPAQAGEHIAENRRGDLRRIGRGLEVEDDFGPAQQEAADVGQAHQGGAVGGNLQHAEIDDRIRQGIRHIARNEGQVGRAWAVARPRDHPRQRQAGPEPPAGGIKVAVIGQEAVLSD